MLFCNKIIYNKFLKKINFFKNVVLDMKLFNKFNTEKNILRLLNDKQNIK